ncbi:hypothetical protein DYB26_002395 [Aphanomyces astaci]|uniref:PDEase domain-containing protein n=1 Tax=Aphanomyces astaci TaxID=112090 RepID=A0A397F3R6_APHAT|nr:hypothetical protein DYB26_002395 [Aphanomyces astaci]RHZ13921.1 hypothetical protein DYB31_000123 [Aphanomyces astaci]
MAWWKVAQDAYCEPHRAYHALEHIASMYDVFQLHHETLALSSLESVFVLAIVFHDVVYDPLSKSNEADSIASFRLFIDDVHPSLGPADICLVESMIEATIRHQLPSSCHSDETRRVVGCFLDLDLAILSRSTVLYDEYAKNIRLEYIAFGDAEFRQGRAAVLRSFLDRDQLYFTPRFQNEWTAAGRANLERELKALTD